MNEELLDMIPTAKSIVDTKIRLAICDICQQIETSNNHGFRQISFTKSPSIRDSEYLYNVIVEHKEYFEYKGYKVDLRYPPESGLHESVLISW